MILQGRRYGKYAFIKSFIENLQRSGILPKKITKQNCKHNILIANPNNKLECGVCGYDIK